MASSTIDSQITAAIAARHTQMAQLQREVDALQKAANALGRKTTGTPTNMPKTPSTTKTGRTPMSAAARKAVSVRMKASWAKRKQASQPTPKASSQSQTATKTGRKPMSAAARKAVSVRMKASWAKRKKTTRNPKPKATPRPTRRRLDGSR